MSKPSNQTSGRQRQKAARPRKQHYTRQKGENPRRFTSPRRGRYHLLPSSLRFPAPPTPSIVASPSSVSAPPVAFAIAHRPTCHHRFNHSHRRRSPAPSVVSPAAATASMLPLSVPVSPSAASTPRFLRPVNRRITGIASRASTSPIAAPVLVLRAAAPVAPASPTNVLAPPAASGSAQPTVATTPSALSVALSAVVSAPAVAPVSTPADP
ncbi:hypothetical protein F5148DRAFT_1307783 [Russula earlei]|uniref:Uncharacterized protein n=1 Tax=Russula earlei TaxID=71964 RepID=A0ACC0U7S9_9AGAM|nr:hypothetical protein F5148DRAFT_1307783 [Russula earlei]